MAKESYYTPETPRSCIYRETFSSEQECRKNGNTVTTPQSGSFVEGTVLLDGYTTNIDISVLVPTGSAYTYRFKCRINDIAPASTYYMVDFREDGTGNQHYLRWTSSGVGVVGFSSNTYYVNGVATNDLSTHEGEWIDIIYSSTNTYPVTIGSLGRFNGGASNSPVDFELVEIYNYALTAEEVSSLYNNQRFNNPSLNPFVFAVTERGFVEERAGNTITNTDVEVVKDGSNWVGYYNGSTSELEVSKTINVTEAFSVSCWINPIGHTGTEQTLMSTAGTDFFLRYDHPSFPDKITCQINDTVISINIYGESPTDYEIIGQWNNYVMTWDGIDELKLYKNGVFIAESPDPGPVSSHVLPKILIGVRQATHFYGKIGESIIDRGVWSAEEVSNYYTSTKFKYGK